ncbi:hypothetical protein BLOT_011722, partial [Blomia tropicalis]
NIPQTTIVGFCVIVLQGRFQQKSWNIFYDLLFCSGSTGFTFKHKRSFVAMFPRFKSNEPDLIGTLLRDIASSCSFAPVEGIWVTNLVYLICDWNLYDINDITILPLELINSCHDAVHLSLSQGQTPINDNVHVQIVLKMFLFASEQPLCFIQID